MTGDQLLNLPPITKNLPKVNNNLLGIIAADYIDRMSVDFKSSNELPDFSSVRVSLPTERSETGRSAGNREHVTRSIKRQIMGHYDSPVEAEHAKLVRDFKIFKAGVAHFSKQHPLSAGSTRIDTNSSMGSLTEVSEFHTGQQDNNRQPLPPIPEAQMEASQMKQSHYTAGNLPYLMREQSAQKINIACITFKGIDPNELGLGSHPQSNRPASATPRPYDYIDQVRSSITPQNEIKQFRAFSSRHSQNKSERHTFDIGLENRPLPISQSLRNCQSIRLSDSYEPRPKMVSLRNHNICHSYKSIKLVVLVPEDCASSDRVGRLVEQASQDGLIVVSVDD